MAVFLLTRIGKTVLARWNRLSLTAAVVTSSLTHALRPRSWPAPTRSVFARQMLFTGVEALPFISLVGLLAGVAAVPQVQLWLSKAGQTGLLGPVLVTVLISELGPLLTGFVVIGRSGAAISTELATMRVQGDTQTLEVQGVDPFLYLVLPRVLAVGLSALMLTVLFILVSLVSGFLVSHLAGMTATPPHVFARHVLTALQPHDVLSLLLKSLVPGLVTGAVCCVEGLHIRGSVTEIPQSSTRAVIRSVAFLFVFSALVSVVGYVV